MNLFYQPLANLQDPVYCSLKLHILIKVDVYDFLEEVCVGCF